MEAWLREVGINEKGEEMLREYIGEGGGLEDIITLEEEDKLELGTSYFLMSYQCRHQTSRYLLINVLRNASFRSERFVRILPPR